MFQGAISTILSNGDEQQFVFRTLLQTIEDHGGDTSHLEKLLADAKEDRILFSTLAKLLIGPVWNLVENTGIDLGEVDYDCGEGEFFSQYPRVERTGAESRMTCWSESRPEGSRTYRLAHIGRRLDYDGVMALSARNGGPYDFAGWRELAAYGHYLPPGTLGRMQVMAPGSELMSRGGSSGKGCEIFPVIDQLSGNTAFSWKGLDRRHGEKFDLKTFFLIRV